MADSNNDPVNNRNSHDNMLEVQSRAAYGDMNKAAESGMMVQLEKIARSLYHRPNKALMKNPTWFCQLVEGAVDTIKADPNRVTPSNLGFYFKFYLFIEIMKGYCGSGTSLEGPGGIRTRLSQRASMKRSTA
ncbi:hypothetical protein diail_5970, partial [Diaporthe ilicicola]